MSRPHIRLFPSSIDHRELSAWGGYGNRHWCMIQQTSKKTLIFAQGIFRFVACLYDRTNQYGQQCEEAQSENIFKGLNTERVVRRQDVGHTEN